MTLREKVAEVEPEKINNRAAGGVRGCPSYYDYLNAVDHPDCHFCSDTIFCDECWNQEYKPKSEITGIDVDKED